MEVAIPNHVQDFDFPSSAVTSPYSSMPSTPARFGHYFFSAPASPFRDFDGGAGDLRSLPPASTDDRSDDFEFDFSEDLERTSLSADELFDGGRIKPSTVINIIPAEQTVAVERGRERTSPSSSRSAAGRRAARSLSPIRSSASEPPPTPPQRQERQQPAAFSSSKPAVSKSSSSKKWRLRDFLLFRSASEGRASDKDPLRSKYFCAAEDAAKSGSFGSSRRRRSGVPAASAHEVHYTVNKAVSEGLKKKTFLPYKQGILGRLAFNPAVHALANGFGSVSRA